MSIEAYEEREKMLFHRASILAAEAERLAGAPTYTDDARAKLKEKYGHAYMPCRIAECSMAAH